MTKKHAFKAITLLWFGSLLGAGFAFLTQVILARQLGPAGFGIFAAALATVTLLTPLAGFGVAQFWLKAFGAEGWAAIRWLNESFKFVTISSCMALLLLIAWSYISHNNEESRLVSLVLSFYILGQVSVELVSAKLQLEEKYMRLSLWQFSHHLLRLLLVTLFAYLATEPTQVVTVAYIYASIAIAYAIAGWSSLKDMLTSDFSLKGHTKTDNISNSKGNIVITDVVSQTWPFGLAGFCQIVYFQSGVILVMYIAGKEAAGLYNVAFTVIAAAYLLPSVVYQKFLLPKLHRWSKHDRGKFYQVYQQGNIVMLIIGIIVMSGIWGTSNWAIPILFGIAYENSIFLLNIMALSIPVMFVAFNSGATLVTGNHIKKKIQLMAIVAILNTLLNLLLIPIYGAIGAAISSVLSNIVLLYLYYNASKNIVFNDMSDKCLS